MKVVGSQGVACTFALFLPLVTKKAIQRTTSLDASLQARLLRKNHVYA